MEPQAQHPSQHQGAPWGCVASTLYLFTGSLRASPSPSQGHLRAHPHLCGPTQIYPQPLTRSARADPRSPQLLKPNTHPRSGTKPSMNGTPKPPARPPQPRPRSHFGRPPPGPPSRGGVRTIPAVPQPAGTRQAPGQPQQHLGLGALRGLPTPIRLLRARALRAARRLRAADGPLPGFHSRLPRSRGR